jgi:two-component system invasion response regulator UvrY
MHDVSIALVDDHVVVRSGIKSLIEVLGNYKITSEFDNGLDFITALPGMEQPDLAIIDLNMPEMNGLETMRWLRKNRPKQKALILTLESDENTIIELFRLGIRGYLPKSCSAELLKKAIQDVVRTGYYHNELLQLALSSEVERAEMDRMLKEDVSDKERIFLQLVCDQKEYTYEQVAELMEISLRTVDGYRESLFKKFNIKSKIGLVLFAIKNDLVKL